MDVLKYEKECYRQGYVSIAGINEAGRGCLAGPVVAAAVILPEGMRIDGVDDSKKLTQTQRDYLYREIMEKAIAAAAGFATHEEIDALNVLKATLLAAQRALSALSIEPDFLLTDYLKVDFNGVPFNPIIKGDAKSHSIAAASIIAKVTRDRLMTRYHDEFPHYNFSSNKGYGTQEHVDAIMQHGASTLHRLTFRGVAWFTDHLIRSKTFTSMKQKMASFHEENMKQEWLQELETKSNFLPASEVKELQKLLRDYETQSTN